MYLDSKNFDNWMKIIMERFDTVEQYLKKTEKDEKHNLIINGVRLLDNQDLCMMLNCSKRTLQRFRTSGLLPCKRINQKTYYLETDVLKFIQENCLDRNKKL